MYIQTWSALLSKKKKGSFIFAGDFSALKELLQNKSLKH